MRHTLSYMLAARALKQQRLRPIRFNCRDPATPRDERGRIYRWGLLKVAGQVQAGEIQAG